MAVIQQGVDSVFETDTFVPLMALGRELAAKDPDERALRILADHSRALTFLIADGVVPSNEDRGYILRRIMRRAIQQGRRIGIEPGFLPTFVERVIEIMGAAYPELVRERDSILLWARSEEEGFGRTLEQGTQLLDEVIARVGDSGDDPGAGRLPAARHLRLPDRGHDGDRRRARAGGRHGRLRRAHGEPARAAPGRRRARRQRRRRRCASAPASWPARPAFRPTSPATRRSSSTRRSARVADAGDGDGVLVKLAESPFYATGGGQVADVGTVECEGGDCAARVVDVVRVGDDQALVVEADERRAARRASASSRASTARRAPRRRPTTPRRTCCTPRCASASARTCARPAPTSAPTSCASTSPTASGSRPRTSQAIEDRVNEWILRNDPVRPITTTLDEARALGAMALFGEKYGDVVRMVQIGDGTYSRELCGGTHVRSTAEIGVFKLLGESSSAANVRRIEAITGPAAVAALRAADAKAREAAALLKTGGRAPARGDRRAARPRQAGGEGGRGGQRRRGAASTATRWPPPRSRSPAPTSSRRSSPAPAARRSSWTSPTAIKGRLGEQSATVLGAAVDGRVHLVAAVTPALVARGVKAGAIVKAAATVAGGGGGGRDTMAQAGGRDPEKLPEAIAAARAAIEAALDRRLCACSRWTTASPAAAAP